MIVTKGKRLKVARTSDSKQKTPDIGKSSANKGKRTMVDQNVEVRKKATLIKLRSQPHS